VFVALVYQRDAILRGQVWRPLTCHFVHAGPAHLVWNLAGTALVALALGPALRVRGWLLAGLAAAGGSSLGVLLLQPEVRVMAGLSALLHGLLAAGAAAEVRRGERLGWAFLIVLAVKVAWEQISGPTPLTRSRPALTRSARWRGCWPASRCRRRPALPDQEPARRSPRRTATAAGTASTSSHAGVNELRSPSRRR
jgi:rhomboid family GlyGly-CTERM serine protease